MSPSMSNPHRKRFVRRDDDDRHIPMSAVIAMTVIFFLFAIALVMFVIFHTRNRKREKLRMKALGLDDIPITAGMSYRNQDPGRETNGEWYSGSVTEGRAPPKEGWVPVEAPKVPPSVHVQPIR